MLMHLLKINTLISGQIIFSVLPITAGPTMASLIAPVSLIAIGQLTISTQQLCLRCEVTVVNLKFSHLPCFFFERLYNGNLLCRKAKCQAVCPNLELCARTDRTSSRGIMQDVTS